MTDITELAQREKFEAWFKSSFHPDKTGPYIKDQLYFAWKAAGAELVEALEKAQQRIVELDRKNCELDSLTQRWAVERAENADRIAELESRTVTVKLPESFKLAKSSSGLTYYYADEVDAALTAAGIKVEAE
ncbi:TPA: hypothetical protein ACF291_003793 [Klebsiella quasipneumoniae subsp. similipneumoniae]